MASLKKTHLHHRTRRVRSAHATTSLLLHSWRSMEKRTREFTATKHIIAVCRVIFYSHCYKAMAGQHGEGEIKIPWAAQPEQSASALSTHSSHSCEDTKKFTQLVYHSAVLSYCYSHTSTEMWPA